MSSPSIRRAQKMREFLEHRAALKRQSRAHPSASPGLARTRPSDRLSSTPPHGRKLFSSILVNPVLPSEVPFSLDNEQEAKCVDAFCAYAERDMESGEMVLTSQRAQWAAQSLGVFFDESSQLGDCIAAAKLSVPLHPQNINYCVFRSMIVERLRSWKRPGDGVTLADLFVSLGTSQRDVAPRVTQSGLQSALQQCGYDHILGVHHQSENVEDHPSTASDNSDGLMTSRSPPVSAAPNACAPTATNVERLEASRSHASNLPSSSPAVSECDIEQPPTPIPPPSSRNRDAQRRLLTAAKAVAKLSNPEHRLREQYRTFMSKHEWDAVKSLKDPMDVFCQAAFHYVAYIQSRKQLTAFQRAVGATPEERKALAVQIAADPEWRAWKAKYGRMEHSHASADRSRPYSEMLTELDDMLRELEGFGGLLRGGVRQHPSDVNVTQKPVESTSPQENVAEEDVVSWEQFLEVFSECWEPLQAADTLLLDSSASLRARTKQAQSAKATPLHALQAKRLSIESWRASKGSTEKYKALLASAEEEALQPQPHPPRVAFRRPTSGQSCQRRPLQSQRGAVAPQRCRPHSSLGSVSTHLSDAYSGMTDDQVLFRRTYHCTL